MHTGKMVFAQFMDHLPWKMFGCIVSRYGGDHRVHEFSCANQFRCMAFAQLTYRDSLRDVNVPDVLLPEADAFHVMNRGYLDFERLHRLHLSRAFFVTRTKSKPKATRCYSHPADRSTGLICDQTIALTVFHPKAGYPDVLRRIRFKTDEGKTLVPLTNNFALPVLAITEVYRCRWQIELFFKWIKQHLHIKSFFGRSENAVKTQAWIQVSVYVLVAFVKKRLALDASPYEILQIVSLTMFETTPLHQLLTLDPPGVVPSGLNNQLNPFETQLDTTVILWMRTPIIMGMSAEQSCPNIYCRRTRRRYASHVCRRFSYALIATLSDASGACTGSLWAE